MKRFTQLAGLIVLITLAACSSAPRISEFNQGCRDTLDHIVQVPEGMVERYLNDREEFCERVEADARAAKLSEHSREPKSIK